MQNDLEEIPEPTTASQWRIALKENPSSAPLQKRFEQWRDADDIHAQAWEEVCRITSLMKQMEPTRPRGHHQNSNVVALKALSLVKRRPIIGSAIAACLALMFGVGLLSGAGSDYETGTKSLQVVALADGSVVTLAPNSAINVSYGKDQRVVELVKGKALFDVTANKQRPFVVQTDQLDVTVLGTSFEVQNADVFAATSVAVRHGKVRVEEKVRPETGSETQILRAGDWVSLRPTGEIASGTRDVSQIATWQNNILLAQGTSLEEVIAELDHYFTGVILVAGEELAHQPVTGVYQLDDPEAALLAIAVSHGAEIYHVSPWLIVVSKG
ncbi:MAG: FecR domain-containing protein [Parvibaculaceae bacterium]|nr:FecR domain-containing protein [Parvibaculaceae bacterium]